MTVNDPKELTVAILEDMIHNSLAGQKLAEEYIPSLVFRVFDVFPPACLEQALLNMKKKCLLVRVRMNIPRRRALPISTMTYHLSIQYERLFEFSMPRSIHSVGRQCYLQLKDGKDHLGKGSQNEDTKLQRKKVVKQRVPGTFSYSQEECLGGHVTMLLSLIANGKVQVALDIPTDIIDNDPDLLRNLEDQEKLYSTVSFKKRLVSTLPGEWDVESKVDNAAPDTIKSDLIRDQEDAVVLEDKRGVKDHENEDVTVEVDGKERHSANGQGPSKNSVLPTKTVRFSLDDKSARRKSEADKIGLVWSHNSIPQTGDNQSEDYFETLEAVPPNQEKDDNDSSTKDVNGQGKTLDDLKALTPSEGCVDNCSSTTEVEGQTKVSTLDSASENCENGEAGEKNVHAKGKSEGTSDVAPTDNIYAAESVGVDNSLSQESMVKSQKRGVTEDEEYIPCKQPRIDEETAPMATEAALLESMSSAYESGSLLSENQSSSNKKSQGIKKKTPRTIKKFTKKPVDLRSTSAIENRTVGVVRTQINDGLIGMSFLSMQSAKNQKHSSATSTAVSKNFSYVPAEKITEHKVAVAKVSGKKVDNKKLNLSRATLMVQRALLSTKTKHIYSKAMNTNDSLLVKPCNVIFHLKSSPFADKYSDDTSATEESRSKEEKEMIERFRNVKESIYRMKDMTHGLPGISFTNFASVVKKEYNWSEKDVKFTKCFIDKVETGKVFGLTIPEAEAEYSAYYGLFNKYSFEEMMIMMCNFRLIYLVGMCSSRYVSPLHAKCWYYSAPLFLDINEADFEIERDVLETESEANLVKENDPAEVAVSYSQHSFIIRTGKPPTDVSASSIDPEAENVCRKENLVKEDTPFVKHKKKQVEVMAEYEYQIEETTSSHLGCGPPSGDKLGIDQEGNASSKKPVAGEVENLTPKESNESSSIPEGSSSLEGHKMTDKTRGHADKAVDHRTEGHKTADKTEVRNTADANKRYEVEGAFPKDKKSEEEEGDVLNPSTEVCKLQSISQSEVDSTKKHDSESKSLETIDVGSNAKPDRDIEQKITMEIDSERTHINADPKALHRIVNCRPWLKLNGEYNGSVLRKLQEAVFTLIMMSPGIKESAIIRHFHVMLKPVATRELLDFLEINGCVSKFQDSCKATRTSLFGPDSSDALYGMSEPYYFPRISSVLNFTDSFR